MPHQVWTHPGEPDVPATESQMKSDAFMLVVSATTPFLAECLDREYDGKVRDVIADMHVPPGEPLPLMVVVTRMDEVNHQPELYVSLQEAVLSWADAHRAGTAFVTSKTGSGVMAAFKSMALRAHQVKSSRSATVIGHSP